MCPYREMSSHLYTCWRGAREGQKYRWTSGSTLYTGMHRTPYLSCMRETAPIHTAPAATFFSMGGSKKQPPRHISVRQGVEKKLLRLDAEEAWFGVDWRLPFGPMANPSQTWHCLSTSDVSSHQGIMTCPQWCPNFVRHGVSGRGCRGYWDGRV